MHVTVGSSCYWGGGGYVGLEGLVLAVVEEEGFVEASNEIDCSELL